MHLLDVVMASPWLYAVIIAVVAIDSVLPVMPGETVVITAGAYAVVQSSPEAWWLLLATVAGALIGDLTTHHLGRRAGPFAQRMRRFQAVDSVFGWAERGLMSRGGMLIVGARFVPGGRTATSLASGMVRYPRGRFVAWALLAASSWAVYNLGIGMLGGLAFRDQPLLGVLLGVGLALLVGLLIERVHVARGGGVGPSPVRPEAGA